MKIVSAKDLGIKQYFMFMEWVRNFEDVKNDLEKFYKTF